MTIDVQCGKSALRGMRKQGATAAIALALAFGVSGGAFAQCAGSYHSSSGAGSHVSAAPTTGVHSAASTTHSASIHSSCASGSSAMSAARLASLHATAFGPGAGHVGATAHRTTSQATGIGKSGGYKKGSLRP
jgi:hypothetical protein